MPRALELLIWPWKKIWLSKKIWVSNKFSRVMLIRKGLRGRCIYIYESCHFVQLFATNLVWTTQAQFTACSKQFCIHSWCHNWPWKKIWLSKKIWVSNKFSRVMLIRKGLRGRCIYIYESCHFVQLFATNLVWTTQAQFTACSKQFCIHSWCHNCFQKSFSNTGKVLKSCQSEPILRT